MFEAWALIIEFLQNYRALLKGIAIGSLAFFLLTPILAPAFIILMPADMLVRCRPSLRSLPIRHGILFILLHVTMNILGFILILLGIMLLFLPGQGLLTLFAGLLLTDLPGKRQLLVTLLGAGRIRPVVKKLRRRFRREAMIWPLRKD